MEAMDTGTLPLRLRRRLHPFSADHDKRLLVAGIALLALPFLLILLLAMDRPDFWQALMEELRDDPRLWIVAVAAPLLVAFFWLTARYERLVLSSNGIEYRSPLRGPLGFLRGLKPDWRLNWSEIESVELRKGPRLPRSQAHQRQLRLHLRHGETRRLNPVAWRGPRDRNALSFRDSIRLTDERFLEVVQDSPLYRVLMDRGLVAGAADTEVDRRDEQPALPLSDYPGGGFNLATHPGTLLLLAGFVGLGGFAVLDSFILSPWRYAEWPPAGPFFAAAVGAAVLAYLVTGRVPPLERWTLTVLLAAAAAGAVWPALLRYNAATDADGASFYRYRQVSVGHFVPVDVPHMPDLHFDGSEYWRSLPDGGEREFRLARGGLEFWQLDHAEIIEAQQIFYGRRGAGEDDGENPAPAPGV